MRWYHYLAYFFGGAFLANSLPHLGNGVSGHAFQSPFATPPGVGLSSSTVNVLWGLINLAVGYLACVPGWQLRTAQDPARTPSCGGHPGHVAHARSHLWPLLRRSVSFSMRSVVAVPCCKWASERIGDHYSAIAEAVHAFSKPSQLTHSGREALDSNPFPPSYRHYRRWIRAWICSK